MYEYLCDNLEVLMGKIFKNVENTGDIIRFTVDENEIYELRHDQDCCEYVYVEDIIGDLNDLIDSPILMSEVSYNGGRNSSSYDSETWSFYKFATIRGYVTIRFYGTSNGYYSETADLFRVK